MLKQYNFFNQLYSRSRLDNLGKALPSEPQSPATVMFCPSDQMIKLWESMVSPYQRIENTRERLDGLSNMGFYFASTWEACSTNVIPPSGNGSPANAFRLSGSFPVPGYSVMVHAKGAFSESIAPRKKTVIPGHADSAEQTTKVGQELLMAEENLKRAVVLSRMTAEDQQALRRLPNDVQEQNNQKRWKEMLKEDPDGVKELKDEMGERVLQTAEGQKIAKDFLTVWGMGDPTQFRPLAFLA